MGETKPDYKVVIDQDLDNNGSSNQTIIGSSRLKLSPAMRAILPIASYCCASILMTVTNKFVLSGYDFNMNFLLLTIQVYIYSSQRMPLKNINMYTYVLPNRMQLQLYYCNHSSSLDSSNFVDSIRKKPVNGYLLQVHLWP